MQNLRSLYQDCSCLAHYMVLGDLNEHLKQFSFTAVGDVARRLRQT